MSLKTKILSILDVVLRVPPIFVMDTILINGFNDFTKSTSQIVLNETSSPKHSLNISNKLLFDSDYEDIDILSISLNGASFGWIVLYLHCNISNLSSITIVIYFSFRFPSIFFNVSSANTSSIKNICLAHVNWCHFVVVHLQWRV